MSGRPRSSAAAAKPASDPRLRSATKTKGSNPGTPGNPANPDIPATPAAAKKLLVDCSLIDAIESEISPQALLRILTNTLSKEEKLSRYADALTQGVVVLLHGALEALAKSNELSVDLAKRLVDHLDKNTNNQSTELDSKLDQNAERLAFLAGRVEHVAEKVERVLDISVETHGQVIALEDFAPTQRDTAPPAPAPAPFASFDAPEPDYAGYAPPPHMQPPQFMQALPPPTTYAQAAMMPPPAPMPPSMNDLKEADARVGLRQREVLLEPVGDRDALKGVADHQLLDRAVTALDKVRESITNGPVVLLKAVGKLARGGLRLIFDSTAAAEWLCGSGPANIFEEAFGNVTLCGHSAQLLVQMFPVGCDLSSDTFMRSFERENNLGPRSLTRAEWIKPVHRRSEHQQYAYAKFTFRSSAVADQLIRQHCFYGASVFRPRRLDNGPTRCTKCQRFGHRRAKCKSDKVICSGCGGEHENKDCNDRGRQWCVSCNSDQHPSHARICPAFKAETGKQNATRPENTRRFFSDRLQDCANPASLMNRIFPPAFPREPRGVTLGEGAAFYEPRVGWGHRNASPPQDVDPARAPSPASSSSSTIRPYSPVMTKTT
ncbi:hypothetical protein FRC09_006364, partial [Ceratobasidium sp. 395]